MAEVDWWQMFATALGGGLTVKLLDIAYAEYQSWKSQAKSSKEFVDDHLDPLLKASDELVGKLRSLAENDFKSISRVEPDERCLLHPDLGSLIYLFGRFYAQVELIRQDGMSIAMSKDQRGRQLQSFFDCLESRRVRIVDRILQRAAGEVFLAGRETKTFVAFAKEFEGDPNIRRWLMPLASFLSRMEHTTERQRLLQYAVVIHALVDTLDPTHQVTRDRPPLPDKLSHRSWTDLRYRVFGVYLKFVKNRQKYLGPPKRAARK